MHDKWSSRSPDGDGAGSTGRHAWFAAASQPYLLTYCMGGVAHDQRIGLSIQPRSLQVRMSCSAIVKKIDEQAAMIDPEWAPFTSDSMVPTAYYIRTRYRIVIFRDKEYSRGNGVTVPTWATIFQTNPTGGTGTLQVSANNFMRLEAAGRFQILADRSFILTKDNPMATPSFSINLRGTSLRYESAAMESHRSNHLFLMAFAESMSNDFNPGESFIPLHFPHCTYQARMSYTDA